MRFKRNRITSTKLYVFQVWLGCFIFQGEKLLLQQSELVPSSVTSRRSARGWRGRQPRESGNMFINCSLKKEKKSACQLGGRWQRKLWMPLNLLKESNWKQPSAY